MVYACWWYYFSKFTEFFDTVNIFKNHFIRINLNSIIVIWIVCLQIFFVLRKKDEHVSLLHVVHHGIMPMSVWFGVRFTPGGHSTFFGLLNTFVHIVMYFYYMVAAMGPQYQKFIWWKKYLTAFQMVRSSPIPLIVGKKNCIDPNHTLAAARWLQIDGLPGKSMWSAGTAVRSTSSVLVFLDVSWICLVFVCSLRCEIDGLLSLEGVAVEGGSRTVTTWSSQSPYINF